MKEREPQKSMMKNDKGMIAVEATISLTAFIVVVIAIISMINLFILHNRVQFALNAAANELSSYMYLYQVMGARDAIKTVDEDGEEYTAPIDETQAQVVETLNLFEGLVGDISDAGENAASLNITSPWETLSEVQGIMDDAERTYESGAEAVEDIQGLLEDPRSTLGGAAYIGLDYIIYKGQQLGASLLASVFTKKNLGSDGEKFLRAYGVDGFDALDFSSSHMFNDIDTGRRLIDFSVTYEVDMSYLGLVFPDFKIQMVQRVTTAAWLDGDGGKVELD